MGDRKEHIHNGVEEHEIANDSEELQELNTDQEEREDGRGDGTPERQRKAETLADDTDQEKCCGCCKEETAHLNAGHGGQNYQYVDLHSRENNSCYDECGAASESESVKNIHEDAKPCSCTSPHEGRKVVDVDLQMHVDQLFAMVFTESNFYLDFHNARKTTDIVQTPWQVDPDSGQKKKKVELTVSLRQSIGPKSSRVTENYVMLPCSHPGHLYSLDLSAYNSGFRYSDTFYCFTHFCFNDTTQHHRSKENNINIANIDPQSSQQHLSNTAILSTCHFSVFAQLIYTKPIWSPVKSIIEKSSWQGIDEFYDSLVTKLKLECDNAAHYTHKVDDDTNNNQEGIRRRKHGVAGPGITEVVKGKISSRKLTKGKHKNSKTWGDNSSWILVFITMASLTLLNVFLYYKLKTLEELTRKHSTLPTNIDLSALRNDPAAHEEWLKFSWNLIEFDDTETDSWRSDVQKTVTLLLEVEDFLRNLTKKIPIEIRHKVLLESFQKTHHSHAKKASTKS